MSTTLAIISRMPVHCAPNLRCPTWISSNTVSRNGSNGILAYGFYSNATVDNNTSTDNTLAGISILVSGVSLHGNVVQDNLLGGISVDDYICHLDVGSRPAGYSCTSLPAFIQGNTVTGNRGAAGITLSGHGLILSNTVTGNFSPGNGGGLSISSHKRLGVMVQENTLIGNTAVAGGGLYVTGFGQGTVLSNTISGNAATTGGGLQIDTGVVAIQHNLITNNIAYATNRGGGVEMDSKLAFHENTVFGNLTGTPANVANDLYYTLPSTAYDLNAQNNYWGGTNLARIATQIWDGHDDPALADVLFNPILTQSASSILVNSGFENGPGVGWTEYSSAGRGVITTTLPHTGHYSAVECGHDGCMEYVQQLITVPENGRLSYWWRMSTDETGGTHDFLKVQLYSTTGRLLTILGTHSNQDAEDVWMQDRANLAPWAGLQVVLRFTTTTDGSAPTSFAVDDVIVQ